MDVLEVVLITNNIPLKKLDTHYVTANVSLHLEQRCAVVVYKKKEFAETNILFKYCIALKFIFTTVKAK